MTTIIEIRQNCLKVRMNNAITLVASYKDEKGIYFFNENLKKQYVPITDKLKRYSFMIEYEHKGRLNGFATKITTIKAKSLEIALEKVRKNFKTIYDISEI